MPIQSAGVLQSLTSSSSSSLGNLLLLFSSIIIVRALWRAVFLPLRDVPGPFFARFTRLWKLRAYRHGRFQETNIELHRKYGAVVRIAPKEFSIDDPAAAKVIYGLGGSFKKGPWYWASGPGEPPHPGRYEPVALFGETDPATHAAHRRKVANLYSMTSLTQMEPFIDSCVDILLSRFQEFSRKSAVIDMARWMQCYAFDVIGEVTVAKRFGFLDRGEDVSGMMEALGQYLQYLTPMGVVPEWHGTVMKMIKLLPQKKSGITAILDFTTAQMQDRLPKDGRKASNDGADFLSRLLKIHADDPDNFRMEDVFTTCMTNIGAGSDTTSISLTSVIYHICKNPEVAQRLKREIEDMSASGLISSPITFKESQKMPYLQAVLKEALRCHPATGLPLERVVPEGGATIAGRYFPAGSIVGINSWVAHANQDIFGADAAVFNPDRWLDKENASKMDRYFFAFGQGSRTCIGKNISLLEMSKLIPQLFRYFEIEMEDPSAGLKSHNAWFVKQYDFKCRIKSLTQ